MDVNACMLRLATEACDSRHAVVFIRAGSPDQVRLSETSKPCLQLVYAWIAFPATDLSNQVNLDSFLCVH